jgi:hypothetical protein
MPTQWFGGANSLGAPIPLIRPRAGGGASSSRFPFRRSRRRHRVWNSMESTIGAADSTTRSKLSF